MIRVTCFLSGRVQGVGMRYAVHRAASEFPVSGFVRNLDDGRVQIVAEGAPEAIDAWIETIQTQAPGAISKWERHVSSATGEFANFTIQR